MESSYRVSRHKKESLMEGVGIGLIVGVSSALALWLTLRRAGLFRGGGKPDCGCRSCHSKKVKRT